MSARRQARGYGEQASAVAESVDLMPRWLVDVAGISAADLSEVNVGRRRWLLDHGIDPADWQAVRGVLIGSRRAHGLPGGALDRTRLRAGAA